MCACAGSRVCGHACGCGWAHERERGRVGIRCTWMRVSANCAAERDGLSELPLSGPVLGLFRPTTVVAPAENGAKTRGRFCVSGAAWGERRLRPVASL
eukprot:6207443-Pleurochrysis_carterae.AAC.1